MFYSSKLYLFWTKYLKLLKTMISSTISAILLTTKEIWSILIF